MARINVTGNAGVGKSTIAQFLSKTLRIPFYSLDSIVWQSGWKPTPYDERQSKISYLTLNSEWIIDGVSRQVWEASDIIIFLDFSRRLSLIRCAKRNWRYLFHSRPGLPPQCPEILIVFQLIKIIFQFPNKTRPNIIKYANKKDESKFFIHIQSKAELESLIGIVKLEGIKGLQLYASN